ncbi:MAG TPA: hypothetical protein VIO11_01515 [Candidatus Methanoperedens sp.]
MYEELKDQLENIEKDYSSKTFRAVVNLVKKEKIKDDELLKHIEEISRKRFTRKVAFTFSIIAGNLLEIIITVAAIILALLISSDWALYTSTLLLMVTMHPLSHYLTGSMLGIRFTHYYLDGPAVIEPTLRIDYFTYLKNSGERRALMHASGVFGTAAAPLFVAFIGWNRGNSQAAYYLLIFFIVLVVFELLTSTKIGDLMRAKREYRFR